MTHIQQNQLCPTFDELVAGLELGNETLDEHLAECRRCRALARLLAEEPQPSSPSLTGPPSEGERETSSESAEIQGDSHAALEPGAVVVASATESIGELLVAVVLDTESDTAGADGLVVAPISLETQFAADADVLVRRDDIPLGYDVLVEVWNHGAILRDQLEEHRGFVAEEARNRIAALYWALFDDLEDEAPQDEAASDARGDGPPILGDNDPRLIFQDEEQERAQHFYRAATMLLSQAGLDDESAHEPVSAGDEALTAARILTLWLDDQGYEPDEYAGRIGVERFEVGAVLDNRIDPAKTRRDSLVAILSSPYRQGDYDPDDVSAALHNSFATDADWSREGTFGTGQMAARTARRTGEARTDALRGAIDPSETTLSAEEIQRRKAIYVNDVIGALEEAAGR